MILSIKRYLLSLILLFSFTYSQNNVFLDFDPIQNNQYLLNEYNINILDTLNYKALTFDQSHHLPIGSFLFNQLLDLNVPDSTEVLTQFIFDKGDFNYRNLFITANKINNEGLDIRYVASSRTYTPLSLIGVSGQSFLQNYLIDITKEEDESLLNMIISYHKEEPQLPISYYGIFDGVETIPYFNTRKSKSFLWGFSYQNHLTNKLYFKISNSNQFTNYTEYLNEANTFVSSINFNNSYLTSFLNLNIKYSLAKISVVSNINLKDHIFTTNLESSSDLNSKHLYLNSGFKINSIGSKKHSVFVGISYNNIYTPSEIDSSYYQSNAENINIDGIDFTNDLADDKKGYLNPLLHFQYNLTNKMKIHFNVSDEIGIFEYLTSENSYQRNNVKFMKSEISVIVKDKDKQINIGIGDISSIGGYIYTNFLYKNNFSHFNLNARKYYYENSTMVGYLDSYISSNIKFIYKNSRKPYSIFFQLNGRASMINGSKFSINSIPMFLISDNKMLFHTYTDASVGVDFNNFIISYHNITNNGNDFSMSSEYSDIGTSFLLPEYKFGNYNLSIFHYLKISWSFKN